MLLYDTCTTLEALNAVRPDLAQGPPLEVSQPAVVTENPPSTGYHSCLGDIVVLARSIGGDSQRMFRRSVLPLCRIPVVRPLLLPE